MSTDFKISVILPIYNTEPYLREALDSVINQTLDFKKNIQMILINDGSVDGSEAICLEYQKKYPNNIIYKYKKNGGVSSARNMGIDLATSKYVTFLDPDDKWSLSSFELAYDFFEKHYDEIDVVSARVQFFEASDKYHTFDYKFTKGTRIADLTTNAELYSGQSTAATTFIKREAIGDLRFDTHLKYGEDSIFINKLMLKKQKYGLLREALYYYRRRAASDSAVNKQTMDKAFYIDTLENYHLELMNYSKENYGEILPYVQAMISYDICWRFTQDDYLKVLNEKELEEFDQRVKTVLNNIDDKILLRNPVHNSVFRKAAIIRQKYGTNFFEELEYNKEDKAIKYKDMIVFKPNKTGAKCCQIGGLNIKDDTLELDVFLAKWIGNIKGCKLAVMVGKKKYYPELHDDLHVTEISNEYGVNEDYYYRYHQDCSLKSINIGDVAKIQIILEFGDAETMINLSYGKFVTNRVDFPEAYTFYGDYLVRAYKKTILVSKPKNVKKTKKKLEKRCIKYLKSIGRDDLAKIRKDYKKFEKKQAKKGEIWLFTDRIDNAGDNGEAIFKYVCEHKPKGIRPMFMIGRDAKPEVIKRLKSEGEMIFDDDKKYPYYFLMTKKLITSSGGEHTINPFGKDRVYLNDMFQFKYYFTNHGVNCGNCSKWLNKFNKNIDVFFTTGANETQRIIDDEYLYTEDQLVITGLPRYDLLYEDTKKQILILPTWRRAIKQSYDANTSSVYFDGFVDTDYFKFYNGLINDERLLKAMRDNGYTGLFCLHPIHMKQSVDFEGNDVFKINDGFVDYNKVFAESAVLVTDYSTIAFDFAHLCKPIVYSQFDKDSFYENQVYGQGFFDYDVNGFGPACKDMDSVVNELISLVENNCENKYIDRVKDFFVYLDSDNCKRVYDYLIKDM